ncbi:hypothetical protein XENTR_v10000537 [Xenopus tropicalis]|uniref:Polyprenal reductase n=1 Tax=Xenopus tropicalis TaxID=8364 RepID=A0A8J0SP39_XENTR|nr:polyprenol reductase isoform X2 [Xenopus tropicalis]KAE8629591.1 hypothetical protein XENTR_v10000537 [Xenopus tropicalis]
MQHVQLFPPGMTLLALVWLLLDATFLITLLWHLLQGCKSGHSLLCSVFQDLIRYGKTKTGLQRPAWLQWFDIPKRCFWHFYCVSLIWNGCLLWILLRLLLQSVPVPEWLQLVLHFLHAGSEPQILVSTDNLLTQCHWYHILGLALYIWASLHQYRCHCILAGLRKSASGNVINLNHSVPCGDWFERVSCPHYFAELLIYVSIAVVFGLLNTIWWLVVLFVLLNQALAALLCHEFYHEKFDTYPIHRKAFIPFIF